MTQAFTLMKATNCLVVSLVVVPTYLLARGLVGRWWALLAAMLAVAVSDVAYSGTIMTENAFYPVFAFWCWATVRAFRTPTIWSQLLSLGLLVLAYLTRPQAVFLVPALLTALALVIGLDAWSAGGRPLLRSLLRAAAPYLTFAIALVVGAAGFLVVEVGIRGKGWGDLLGAYSSVATVHYSVHAVLRWFVYHVGEIDFAVVLLPFAGFLLALFVGLRPRAARELRVFAAVAAAASFWLILGVAAFASTPYANRLLERSTFYVAPLFMVALVAAAGRGFFWTHRLAAAVAAVSAVGLIGVLQYSTLLGPNEANDTFSLFVANSILERGWVAVPQLQSAIMVGATVLALIFILTPRRLAALVPLLALLALALANGPVERRIRIASQQSRDGAVSIRRDWIDHAVGPGARVAALWTGRDAYVTLWDNEFFNRSVKAVYTLGPPPDGLAETPVTFDDKTGKLLAAGAPIANEKYLLADPTVSVMGSAVAHDPRTGMTVYRISRPLRYRYDVQGLYPDFWSGATLIYTEYGCRGGRLAPTIFSDKNLHPRPMTIVARSGSKPPVRFTYHAGRLARFSVPLERTGSFCRVTFTMPTAVPQLVTGTADTRPLGVRFYTFAYKPPGTSAG